MLLSGPTTQNFNVLTTPDLPSLFITPRIRRFHSHYFFIKYSNLNFSLQSSLDKRKIISSRKPLNTSVAFYVHAQKRLAISHMEILGKTNTVQKNIHAGSFLIFSLFSWPQANFFHFSSISISLKRSMLLRYREKDEMILASLQ